jgi:hypothetical protein
MLYPYKNIVITRGLPAGPPEFELDENLSGFFFDELFAVR